MKDEAGPDSKLITVPAGDPMWADTAEIGNVSQSLRDEIEHFFNTYKDLQPGKQTTTGGFSSKSEALDELEDARRRFLRQQAGGRAESRSA
jgi:inorganic pyrophosphatase